jgi:hypothetical protein
LRHLVRLETNIVLQYARKLQLARFHDQLQAMIGSIYSVVQQWHQQNQISLSQASKNKSSAYIVQAIKQILSLTSPMYTVPTKLTLRIIFILDVQHKRNSKLHNP